MKFPRLIIEFLIESYNLIAFLLSAIFFGYFVFVNILFALFPDLKTQEKMISSISSNDLNFLLLTVLGILMISVCIQLGRKKEKFVLLISYPLEEIITYFIVSIFLGYFISKNILFLENKFILFKTIIISTALYVLLPQVVENYISYNFSYYRKLIIDKYKSLSQLKLEGKNLLFHSVFYGVILLLIFTVITGVSSLIIYKVNNYLVFQRKQREQFIITRVVPRTTTYAEQVNVYGYNFGWRKNEKYILQTDFGPLEPSLWNDTKLNFIIPLHWKEGKVKFWLEKTSGESSNSALLRSNEAEINIISRWDFYPEQSDYDQDMSKYLLRITKKIKEIVILKWHIFDFIR